MALILALLFMVLLSVVVVEFMYEAQVEASFAENQGGELEAYIAAKSAVARGIELLAADLLDPMLNGETQMYDSELDGWYQGQSFEPLNEGFMRASISDEYGKINLNALMDASEGRQPVERDELVAALREFFAMRDAGEGSSPDTIVDSILDWVDYADSDEEHPDGAETDYYSGLENPYVCKNGPMDSIEELLLIKGITPKVYFGDAEKEQLPLSEYLTVQGDWQGRVNINTARPEVIAAIIGGSQGGAGDLGQAQRIYEDVRMQPMTDASQLGNYGFDANATGTGQRQNTAQNPNLPPAQRQQQQGPFTVKSNVFRIYGDGMMGEVMVRVEAYVWRTPMDLSDWGGNNGYLPNNNANNTTRNNSNNSSRTTTGGAKAGSQANSGTTSGTTSGTKNTGQSMGGMMNSEPPKEPFRILDWKVIR